jgi:hypothetical protein
MVYYFSGDYYIFKKQKEVTHGKYDAIIADSYNNEMTSEDSVYFTIYKNDLNGIRTSTDSIKDWVN